MTSPAFDLSHAELERMDAFLLVPPMSPHALGVVGIQGLAAALALSPKLILPGDWMPRLWDAEHGRRPPDFADLDQANAFVTLVMRLYTAVVAALGPVASASFEPLYRRDARWHVADFCRGFRAGVALAPGDWAALREAHPQWLAAFETAAPSADEIDRLLPQIGAFWRAPAVVPKVWDELRPLLERFSYPFPHAAVALALQHRDEVAPHLLATLEALARDPQFAVDDEDYMLQHWAAVFLACWRDTRAYAPMLAILRHPYETLDALYGNALFETFGRALATVCDGDVQPLRALVADESVSSWVRMTVLDAWRIRVMEGDAEPAPFEDFLIELGTREAERLRHGPRGGDPEMIDDVAAQACEIDAPRLVQAVRGWFDEGLIDEKHVDRPHFEKDVARSQAERLAEMRRRRHSYIEDVAAEISWWASYQEPKPARTIVRDGPKIGRNDPCPCGSGRKYKKCHGAN